MVGLALRPMRVGAGPVTYSAGPEPVNPDSLPSSTSRGIGEGASELSPSGHTPYSLRMSSVASLLLLAPACSPVDPQPGQLGGPCRASLTPCDPGLSCNGNGCAEPNGQSGANYGATFTFKDNKKAVEADGKDTTIITTRFFETTDGLTEPAPANLQFRMWVDPPEAGTLEFSGTSNPEVMSDNSRVPWRITDDSGGATVRFTGCDKELSGCIKFATIRVAVAPDVLVAVSSVAIENIGAGPALPPPGPEAEPGEPGVIPTPPLPEGYGPDERCVGRSNEIYVNADEESRLFRGEGTFPITEWRLRAVIPPLEAPSLLLQITPEGLPTTSIRINAPTGEVIMVGEYPNVVDPSRSEDGFAQFSLQATESMFGSTCSRLMERRFAVQELRIEDGKIQRMTFSFVHGCDGGIIEGCFTIEPIP